MSDRTIWRVRLRIERHQHVQLPPGSRILTVQRRLGEPVETLDLWADVPADDRLRMLYSVVIVGTGDAPPLRDTALRYVSTVQLAEGADVFHIYATVFQPGEVRTP